MKLVVYTIPYEIINEDKKINYLLENGLDVLHTRKPGYSYKDYEKIISEINPSFYSKIILHDYYSLSKKYPLGGIHIPFNKSKNTFYKLYLKYLKRHNRNLQISSTVNEPLEVENVSDIVDETYLGPIFMKYSEENTRMRFDQFELKRAVSNCNNNLVALGGITIDKLSLLQQIGFKSVALQSSIWKSENIYNSFQAFKLSVTKFDENKSDAKVAIG